MAAAAAWTTSSRAQKPSMPVIGYLCPESPELFGSRLKAFHQGLREAGFVEGRDVAIEYRWANGQYARLPALAGELIARDVDVVVAPGGAPVALAAKAAGVTKTIVFEMGGDPVQLGVVDSLSRPGGNITGISSLSVDVSPKRLELMHELLPAAKTLGVVTNPTSPTASSQLQKLQAAAETLGVHLQISRASKEEEFEAVFASVERDSTNALVFTSDPYFAFRSRRLADLALKYRVPAITQTRDFPTAGGLMSYGGDFVQSHRRAGVYAGRVLKGEKPADLPVQLVTKVEFVINLKTAKLLGHEFSASVVSGADEVIE
ncbi:MULTISPECIES: ABC transporter substrate-binding protein [Bradyrhizobium]|nr:MULTISPECIES: ABC transporter substrate-binding protein [unclassified Bradyrhizobium]KRP89361.1 ABC transporter substrate-binding protein [Bradyrhizobium pachyrhizi]MCC8947108.1 ABC transporter substrate-binding protein [Bradyrhizobium brasilense]OMI05124.1 ABC transporter substrate-binding protein [Bradyrhizobium brasilense]